MAKEIKNSKDIEFLLNLKEEDINKSLLIEIFGDFNGTQRFNQSDILKVPKNMYGPEGNRNTNEFITTVGIWIFNKFFIEKDLFDVFKYINKNVDGDVLRDMNKELSYGILEDRVTIEQLKTFIHKQQFMLRFVSVFSPNHTLKMLKTSSYLDKKKKALIKKYENEIKEGNEIIAAEIEKELLKDAKEYLKDDPSLDMYESKSRSKFNNTFKNMFVMKGAIMNPDPTKGFDIATSNYMDGISKEDFSILANSLVGGAYAKSKNTEVGGYWVKLFLSAFQHLVLDKPGSDCGTKKYIEVALTSKNIDMYMYSYVIEGTSLVEITSQNRNSYIGKTVKMRFSSLCESKKGFCNKCVGNLYYRLGIENIGLTSTKIPTKIMMLSMKKFHNSVVAIVEMDVMKAFSLE